MGRPSGQRTRPRPALRKRETDYLDSRNLSSKILPFAFNNLTPPRLRRRATLFAAGTIVGSSLGFDIDFVFRGAGKPALSISFSKGFSTQHVFCPASRRQSG